MLITMVLIIILEFTVIESLAFKILSSILFLGSLITGIYTYIINHGVTFREKDNQKGRNHYCNRCNFSYPKSEETYQHCSSCGVCAPGTDHHCGVFGKCIGRRNKITFYLFPAFTIILLIICFISVLYHYMNEVKKNEKKDK